MTFAGASVLLQCAGAHSWPDTGTLDACIYMNRG